MTFGSHRSLRQNSYLSLLSLDAPGFTPDASIPVTLYGPSDRIRTCGILLPKQARYQLRYTRLLSFLSGWSYSPKPMSELSARGLAHSLALSGTPAVPLWNSIGLFISGTAFGFWDLCGIEFCILKVLPTGFTSNSGCFLPQRAAQKLRRINKEISAMTKKQQADLDDSQPAERRCLFDVLSFGSNACSFARECNADFYN